MSPGPYAETTWAAAVLITIKESRTSAASSSLLMRLSERSSCSLLSTSPRKLDRPCVAAASAPAMLLQVGKRAAGAGRPAGRRPCDPLIVDLPSSRPGSPTVWVRCYLILCAASYRFIQSTYRAEGRISRSASLRPTGGRSTTTTTRRAAALPRRRGPAARRLPSRDSSRQAVEQVARALAPDPHLSLFLSHTLD